MSLKTRTRLALMVAGLLAAALVAGPLLPPWVFPVKAADHRDSPLIDEDPSADIADVLVFLSPSDPNRVVFVMTVNPFAVPALRSSYSFSPDVLYQFKIDTTGDGREDLVIQAMFEGFESARDPRCPAPGGGQFFTVLGPAKPKKTGAETDVLGHGVVQTTNCTLVTAAASPDGVRIWAGLSDDPFVADVGQLNRILGGQQEVFRDLGPALRGRSVRADGTSGVDAFGGFNVSALVVEVPRHLVQGTASRAGTYLRNAHTIGVWGTTSRARTTKRDDGRSPRDHGPFVQIQRAGHQVFKTVFVLPVSRRDVFNQSSPQNDVRDYSDLIPDALTQSDPTGNTIAARAALLAGLGLATPPNGAPLLFADLANDDPGLLRQVLLPDVLRFDLDFGAADLGLASNGLQNGRRLGDDVVDIVLRLGRQLIDVKFPDGSGLPGSGPLGSRRALDCSAAPTPPAPLACQDRRVFAVLQGTDFIRPDATLADLSISGNDRPFRTPFEFPYVGFAHPLPGSTTPPPGTVGFPVQE